MHKGIFDYMAHWIGPSDQLVINTDELYDLVILQARYRCKGCGTACGLLTNSSGTITDGSGPSNYSDKSQCEWIIAQPSASLIKVTFSNFSTQPLNDVVQVFQCSTVDCWEQQQLAELSGTYQGSEGIISTTGYMKVIFLSDGSINSQGFAASWTSVWPTMCLLPVLVVIW